MSGPALSRVSTNIHVELYLPYDEEEGTAENILDNILNNNEFLMKENQLFASFVHRHSGQVAAALEEEEELLSGVRNRQERELHRSKNAVLTMEQKLEVAARELEDIREDKDSVENQGNSIISRIQSIMSELNLCASDERKLLFYFKKEALKVKEDENGNKSPDFSVEKLINFYQNTIKERQNLVEKYKLKNAALRARLTRVKKRNQSKETAGDGLREIDYEQLKIENRQFLHRLEDFNQDLMKLKITTGNVVAQYNELKFKLTDTVDTTTALTKEASSRRELLQKLSTDISAVVKDRDRADNLSQVLAVRTHKGSGPSTRDYIEQKKEEALLLSQVKDLERKIEIAKIKRKLPREVVI
ncbi:hypothetical protein RCL1_002836 [Eukaryota sp. TZLM3-RCL]